MPTNTDTALEIYSKKFIEGLSNALPAIRSFSLDLSDELTEPGLTIRVPLIAADAAAAWNDTSNNYSRTAATLKDQPVVLNKRLITGFAITQDQMLNFRPAWWEGKAALNARSIADAVFADLVTLVTGANYGDTAAKKLAVDLATFGRKALAALRAKIVTAKLQPAKAVLCLNPDFFAALLADLDAQVYGGREAVVGGTIPGLLGFRAIVEMPQYTGPGFVCHPDAIAIGSRRIPVADTTPYKEFGSITEPDTGLTMNRVILTDGNIGKTSFSVECGYGYAVGNPDSLLRLTA